MNRLPARRSDLLTRSLGAETIVVNSADSTAHALSPVAASVFALCDGQATVASAASALSLTAADVNSAIVTLTSLGLVTGVGMTRRVAIQRAALIGGGALVATVAAPLAAAHASGTGAVSGGAASTTIGSTANTSGEHDSRPDFVIVDGDLTIPAGATVTSFNYSAVAAGSIYFVLVNTDDTVAFVSPIVTAVAGTSSVTVSYATTVPVRIGHGTTSSSAGVIPFDGGPGTTGFDTFQATPAETAVPSQGTQLTYDYPGANTDSRTYAFGATYTGP